MPLAGLGCAFLALPGLTGFWPHRELSLRKARNEETSGLVPALRESIRRPTKHETTRKKLQKSGICEQEVCLGHAFMLLGAIGSFRFSGLPSMGLQSA